MVGKDFTPRGCKPVIASLALTRLLDPLPVDPSAPFHPVEHRIEGCDVESQDSAGAVVDQFRDFVAMSGSMFDGREHHELGTAAFYFSMSGHMWWHNISEDGSEVKTDAAAERRPGARSCDSEQSVSRCLDRAHVAYLVFVAVNSPLTFIGCTLMVPLIVSVDCGVPL